MKRTLIMLASCLALALLLGACGGSDTASNNTTTSNTANTTTATSNKGSGAGTATSNSAASNTSSTASTSGDKLGIPECDEYIAKYEACVNSKVPEAQRAQVKTTLDQSRSAWRAAASTPQGKATLPGLCKQATEMARNSLKSYGCEF